MVVWKFSGYRFPGFRLSICCLLVVEKIL